MIFKRDQMSIVSNSNFDSRPDPIEVIELTDDDEDGARGTIRRRRPKPDTRTRKLPPKSEKHKDATRQGMYQG